MPRPVKCRKVCHFPNVLEFLPADDTEKKMPIVLTVDEYETIRLLDKKGYSQEQCADSMKIARTTVQRIYEIARKKIADALIDGHPLKIEGGDFIICDGQSSDCSFGGCYKHEIYQKYAVEKVQLINVNSKMRKNLFYFLTKKGRTFPLVKISFLKDIDSLGS